jgi:2-polyprenyl-3-methyl-5-hydroxy-6-metoxy-1,4-benzoquinol methylase
MKNVSCLLCETSHKERLLTNTQDPFGKRIGSKETCYDICTDCGFVYQNPKLESHEIESLYARDYYDRAEQTVSEKYIQKKEEYALQSFEWIASNMPVRQPSEGFSVLDIGSNTGAFLSLFVRAGWNAHGVEPSTNMCNVARKQYNLEQLHTMLFQKDTFSPQSFNMVTLLHTLEHLEDPSEILANIREVLRSDGYLYVEVPDIYHPKSAFYTSYFAAPHLYTFSQASLIRLLAKQGFHVVAQGYIPRGVCVLAQVGEPTHMKLTDDHRMIVSLIKTYQRRHDRDAFLYQWIANNLLARVLIKCRIPWLSKLLGRFRESVRVNKII